MKYTLVGVFVLALLWVAPALGQAEAVVPDSSGMVESLPPPAPVDSLTAEDKDNDHGHAVTLKWKKSADDGAGRNSVLWYDVYRWKPYYEDSVVNVYRDSVAEVQGLVDAWRVDLPRTKINLKHYQEGKVELACLDSVIFRSDTIRSVAFTETARTTSDWFYQPDSIKIFTQRGRVKMVKRLIAETDDVVETETALSPYLSEHGAIFSPGVSSPITLSWPETSPAVIRAADSTGFSYVLGAAHDSLGARYYLAPELGAPGVADSMYIFFAGAPEQIGATTIARNELREQIVADSIQNFSESVAMMTDSLPKLKDLIRPLRGRRDSVYQHLSAAYDVYPDSTKGRFVKVSTGPVPSGSEEWEEIGRVNKSDKQHLPDNTDFYYLVKTVPADIDNQSTSEIVGPVQCHNQWFNTGRRAVLLFVLLYGVLMLIFVNIAKRGAELYVRPLGGISAVDDAIGRATEMGRPILYVLGLGTADMIATIASFTILSRVAKQVAEYQTELIVPCYDPIVMTVAQEVVKSSFLDAGRPDHYHEDIVYFVTQNQFAYVAAVNGVMLRELPATNVYMGRFYAESLILAETGAAAGSIQIAGTDEVGQLPFFIVACDYTLIGEELYAASAYLGREPVLLGSLKAQDWAKAGVMILAVVGMLSFKIGAGWLLKFANWFKVLD